MTILRHLPWRALVAVAIFAAIAGSSDPAIADKKPRDERSYLLSLGGHVLVADAETCDRDIDLVGCSRGWPAAGLDIGVQRFVEPTLGMGGRFAMTTGLDASGYAGQPHRQWLLRLVGEARIEDGGEESGGSLGIGVGAALLLDRMSVAPAGSIPGTPYELEDRKGADAGPLLSVNAGYDFVVYDRLLLGFVLRAEVAYLLGVNPIDLGGGSQAFSSGFMPLVELGMRMSMSQ